MPGKTRLGSLGKLGWGLISVKSGEPSPYPPPPIEEYIILEDNTGFILLEDGSAVVTEA